MNRCNNSLRVFAKNVHDKRSATELLHGQISRYISKIYLLKLGKNDRVTFPPQCFALKRQHPELLQSQAGRSS